MIEYDEELKKLTTPIWEDEYIASVAEGTRNVLQGVVSGIKKDSSIDRES